MRPVTLLPELEELLAARSPDLAATIRRRVHDLRRCVRLSSTRTGKVPLRGGLFDRLLGRPPPQPVLSPLASKFGGMPYAESPDELDGATFIGQINFAEASAAMSSQDAPRPDGLPAAGLLAVDLTPRNPYGRVRWYPHASVERAVQPASLGTVAKYEARVAFHASWSLRGLEWFDAIPESDEELWTYMNELQIPDVDQDVHRLFGHADEALNDHYGLQPAAGRADRIRDYALVWRIAYDNAAGFSWGTNWLYVVIHVDDLARGALENAIVTGANA